MLNLHTYLPDQYPENELIMINLENLYKERSRESHEVALEAIFAEGVKYANEVHELGMDEYNTLKEKYEALVDTCGSLNDKYEVLLKNFSGIPEFDPDAEKIALTQTMGMGNALK